MDTRRYEHFGTSKPPVARIPIPVPPPGIIAGSASSLRTRIRVHKKILRNLARERRRSTTNILAQPLQKEQITTAERGAISPQRINPLRESPVITDMTGKVYGQRSCSLRTPEPSANVTLPPVYVPMELDSAALELVQDSEPPLAMGTSVSYGSSSSQQHRRSPHPLPTYVDITDLVLANWSTPELSPKEQLQSPVAIDPKPRQKRSRAPAPPVPSTRVLRSMSQAKTNNDFTPATIPPNAPTPYEIAPFGVRREPRKPLRTKRVTPSTPRISASAVADDASATPRYNLRPRKRELGEDQASKQGGATELVYTSLVVGGGDNNKTYRGDSWICPAAIQAGVISASKGGCGTLRLVGNFTNFLPVVAHGVSSIGFPSVFPSSFRFLDSTSLGSCTDLRSYALAYNVICTSILMLLLRPEPIWIFWCLLCVGFWHITLFSDPRSAPPLLSDGFGTFLPALFVGYAFWRTAWRFTLPKFEGMPLERAVWYLAPFWAGVYFNVITAKIPIDRLVASDLNRDGALTALVIIAIVVLVIVLNQVWVIRKAGMFFYFLWRYILAGIVVVVLASLPGLTFRLHHYIAAILLMPLTAVPSRVSAVCQAFLLGMFLQGVAKFGFDSILQSAAELQRDAPLGSSLPSFYTNSSTLISSLTNTSISWDAISSELSDSEGWNGFSLLVDDVQRSVGDSLSYSLSGLQIGITHFFRLAYQRDGVSGDYTKAATLFPNGTWLEPLPGPS
ncbi:putative protein YIL067C [Saccharomyces cerevisiae S288c] [Rhizoctonia solani]|uniref:LCCL domain-containing protein n=1 Tax=Rhizoctonia solani TaxID=456999 RepID=A0A0K6GFY2_9AGAM|nr:putative protein YIL067C [Saccharomyces cerevisiae S288c] [Rhizoctonia solani]